MQRLRHSVRAVREPFGTAGLIIAVAALVFSLAGGAYAASGGLSGKQKKEVEKIAKKFAAKPGAGGANGAAGSSGPQGAPGANGINGSAGSNGVGVTISNASIAECASGGIKVTSAGGDAKVCNGTTGFTEALPSGKTETGAWSVGASGVKSTAFEGQLRGAISFPIPLSESLPSTVVTPEDAGTTPECPTAFEPVVEAFEKPEAEPGHLCIYESVIEGLQSLAAHPQDPETLSEGNAGLTGAWIHFNSEVNGFASGTWAVTAE